MYEVIDSDTSRKTVDRVPTVSHRLSFSPDRQAVVRLEQQDYTLRSAYHGEIPERDLYDGKNIHRALSTSKCDFSYGRRAVVATCAIAKNASPELKAKLIKHLEQSILAQLAKQKFELINLNLNFPSASEYI